MALDRFINNEVLMEKECYCTYPNCPHVNTMDNLVMWLVNQLQRYDQLDLARLIGELPELWPKPGDTALAKAVRYGNVCELTTVMDLDAPNLDFRRMLAYILANQVVLGMLAEQPMTVSGLADSRRKEEHIALELAAMVETSA